MSWTRGSLELAKAGLKNESNSKIYETNANFSIT